MIALGTLVGTQVHKRNVSEDLKKLERTKELREAAGEEPVKLGDSQKLGLKTKEGAEALSHDTNLMLAKALKTGKDYVPGPNDLAPEDPKQVQEELNREFNIPTQSAFDSVSKMIESKKRLDQIKSNYKDKVTFETATKNMQLSKGAWNKNMDDIIKKGGK